MDSPPERSHTQELIQGFWFGTCWKDGVNVFKAAVKLENKRRTKTALQTLRLLAVSSFSWAPGPLSSAWQEDEPCLVSLIPKLEPGERLKPLLHVSPARGAIPATYPGKRWTWGTSLAELVKEKTYSGCESCLGAACWSFGFGITNSPSECKNWECVSTQGVSVLVWKTIFCSLYWYVWSSVQRVKLLYILVF